MQKSRRRAADSERGGATNGADAKFRAFSDSTRLRILHLLQAAELCVGDLVKVIQVPQPTASRHLAYLRRSGFARKNGQWAFYALAPAKTTFLKKLMECLGHCFDEVSDLKADKARAAKLREAGGCCPK